MDNQANSYETMKHLFYLKLSLDEARKSPPKATNFCVGACIVAPAITEDEESLDKGDFFRQRVLATGYTLECEGNTHAEQSCFIKLAAQYGCSEEALGEHLPDRTTLYSTVEPCNKRSAGNKTCVDRILSLKRASGQPAIHTVCVGVLEPETFVGINDGRRRLEAAGVRVVHVLGLEAEILSVATAGHDKNKNRMAG